jgi:hypothetical protein
MKALKLLWTILLLASLVACEPPVTFTEPQPTGVTNLSKFPKRLQGEYFSLADNSSLLISATHIQRIYDFDHKVHPNQLDSTSKLSGDTVINLITNEKTIVTRYGDSLVMHVYYTDTLFLMDYDNVVRRFKGHYFLNTRYNKTSWEVKKMQLTKGQLVISSIATQLEIDNLKEITETPSDTVAPYAFTATKKQFREFVKKDGFTKSESFIKKK